MNQLKAFWEYGTTKPIQRIGLIVIAFGILLSVMWSIDYEGSIDSGVGFYFYNIKKYPPTYEDDGFYGLFYHIVIIGLFMTWLYGFSVKVLCALKNWITANK